jgi:hypothetical protein
LVRLDPKQMAEPTIIESNWHWNKRRIVMEKGKHEDKRKKVELSRRQVLKYGMMSGAFLIGSRTLSWAQQACQPEELLIEPGTCGIQEVWSNSPFIVNPFALDNLLPQPAAMRPGWRLPEVVPGSGAPLADPADPNLWKVRKWIDPATGNCVIHWL